MAAVTEMCRPLKAEWELHGITWQAQGVDDLDELLTPVDPLACVKLELGKALGTAEIWPTGYVRLERVDASNEDRQVEHVTVDGCSGLRNQLMELTGWVITRRHRCHIHRGRPTSGS